MLTFFAGLYATAGFRIFARSGIVLSLLGRAANLRQHDCRSIVAGVMAGLLQLKGSLDFREKFGYPRLRHTEHRFAEATSLRRLKREQERGTNSQSNRG